MVLPETAEVEPAGDAVGTVIWLHGLGADGHDFEPIVPEIGISDRLPLRFVFPHAPVRAVTINGGMQMRAWYDIVSLERGGPQDEAGIRESAALLDDLIAAEEGRGVAADKIVLAGFSQGGAIALHCALRYAKPLAGLMALSTWLPLGSTLQAEVFGNERAQSRALPVFMAHGEFDPMLPIAFGRESMQALQKGGYAVEWHEYPMAHAVCADEIAAIGNWLLQVFNVSGEPA